MKKMLINANQQEEVRIALVDNMWLYDLHIENFNYEQKKSNIYKGIIIHIEVSLEAVFVNYGYEKHGFLPVKEISNIYLNEEYFNNDKSCIKDYLKEGQKILVQVLKEERLNKGAVLTTFISLAGSYLVLITNSSKTLGISKRIDKYNRKIIKEILKDIKLPENMGIIVRTSGIGKSLQDLQLDLNFLLKNWELINYTYKENSTSNLIHKENNLTIKIFKDYLTPDISEIIIDNINFINESKKCLIDLGKNDFNNKIKLYSGNSPLFSFYKIESQIESAFKRNVKLPSGGSIIIDSTEALTAIDINSSKSTKYIDIEETALNTNLEAANEIARQLRLRDLGGLIVIDFIDMNNKKNCNEVENQFKKATYQDRAKIRFGYISKFGLLEISRQRLKNSLNESNHYICPRCKGNGFIRNNKSLSLSILRLIEEESLKEDIKEIHVITPIDIGTYLLNEKRSKIDFIEKRQLGKLRIVIVPYDKIKSPNYIIIKIKYGEETSIISYLLPKIHDKNININNKKNIFINKFKNLYEYKNDNIDNSIKKINNYIYKIKKIIQYLFNIYKFLFSKLILKLYNYICITYNFLKEYIFNKNNIFKENISNKNNKYCNNINNISNNYKNIINKKYKK